MSFDDLPNEIQYEIFIYTKPRDTILICNRWYELSKVVFPYLQLNSIVGDNIDMAYRYVLFKKQKKYIEKFKKLVTAYNVKYNNHKTSGLNADANMDDITNITLHIHHAPNHPMFMFNTKKMIIMTNWGYGYDGPYEVEKFEDIVYWMPRNYSYGRKMGLLNYRLIRTLWKLQKIIKLFQNDTN